MLVVEDDDDLRGLIRAALDDAGFAAVEAADGAAALAACSERDPDVVLLDLTCHASVGKRSRKPTDAERGGPRSSS